MNSSQKPATARMAEERLKSQPFFNYWEAELSDIKTAGEEDAVKLKLRTSCSETKWLSLRPSEFEAVEALLVELYAAREQSEAPAQPAYYPGYLDYSSQPAQPANSLEAMQQEAESRKAGRSFNTPAERKAWLQSFGQEQS